MPKLIEKEQDFWNVISSVVFISLAVLLTIYLKNQNNLDFNIPAYDFILLILATFRLVRLFTYDSVTGYIRKYLSQFESGPKKTISNLISCPWCTGMWMSLVTTFLYLAIPASRVFILILALAGAGTFIQIIVWKIGLEK